MRTVPLDRQVQACVVRRDNGAAEPCNARLLTAHQLGGVILQPIPFPEMERICGTSEIGFRVLLDCPDFTGDDWLTWPGNYLLVQNREYVIRRAVVTADYLHLFVVEP